MKVSGQGSIAARIERAFHTASSATGTPFDYLLKTAIRESNMKPHAKAPTSSATGLFQFIESTWLETVKKAGPQHGLKAYADQITARADGRYTVADPKKRAEILALRTDPQISAIMAGALTRSNAAHLAKTLGREPNQGELYMAHFLGAGGANRLITGAVNTPDQRADTLFPAQARANRPIFYQANGQARTLAEVYTNLIATHGQEPAPTMMAYTPARPGADPLAAMPQPQNPLNQGWRATRPQGAFHALFRNDPAAPTGPVVAAFWAGFGGDAANAAAPVALTKADPELTRQQSAPIPRSRPAGQADGPLDLTKYLKFNQPRKSKDVLPPA